MTKNTGPTPFLLAFRMTRIFLTRILFFFHVQIPSLEMFFYKAKLNNNNVSDSDRDAGAGDVVASSASLTADDLNILSSRKEFAL